MAENSTPQPGIKRFIGVDFNIGALRSASPRFWAFVSILGIFIGLAVVAEVLLFVRIGAVGGMRDTNPFGMWFVGYMYYVGLSAGGLAVYGAVHLFGAEQFRPLSRFAVLQGGVLVMMALMGFFSEIPGPMYRLQRMVSFLTSPNPTAPFVYTGSAAVIYMIICFVDLWVMITGTGGHKLAFKMTLIALPFAVYLHTTTAFILSLNKSRELWHSAVMVPIFLTSAVASGVALLIIIAYIAQKFAGFKFEPSMFRSLSTLLATVMIIDQFLLVVEVISVFWGTSAMPGHAIRLSEFVTGRFAIAFLPVMVLGLSAFALLARRSTRHIPAVQLTACGLYVVAIFFKRFSLMAMGFSYTTLGRRPQTYIPSLVELLISVGVVAIGILIVTLAIKVLPMAEPGPEHEDAHGQLATAPEPSLEGGVASL